MRHLSWKWAAVAAAAAIAVFVASWQLGQVYGERVSRDRMEAYVRSHSDARVGIPTDKERVLIKRELEKIETGE
jgi:hypothetical protein